MRIMKRWLTLILTMSIVLSDHGYITAFATGNDVEVETLDLGNDEDGLPIDENEVIVTGGLSGDDEPASENETNISENVDVSPEDDGEGMDHEVTGSVQDDGTVSETDVETEFPAVHIGQIRKGEELPSSEDSEFIYDLPISLEASDSVLLFVNYNIDTTFIKEEEGTLIWSILRGVNGMEEGSVSLVNEEDDWADFEVVPASPFFTMTENEDEESDYYQTVELAAVDFTDEGDGEESKDYSYYIRAAWYFGAGEEMSEEFYAAATIAVLPVEDTDMDEIQDNTDIDEVQDDTIDAEEDDPDTIQDDESVTEEVGRAIPEDALLEESYVDMALEEDDAGDNVEGVTSEFFESDEQQDSGGQIRNLILKVGDAAAQTPIEMYPGGTKTVTAKIVSVDVSGDTQEDTTIDPAEIVWESSDKTVAAVENGVISANAEGVEGYAEITAQYDGLTAAAVVKVVQEDTEQILNLDGDIWIVGFQQESEDFVYTGQKITQDIRVYYNEILLQEKTDYTLTYKNNVNAAAYNSAKAPSVTIKLKGQYSGSRTLYFTIKPRNIDENGTMGYEQVVQHAKTIKIPAPTLYYNNKKLTSNKDFTCDYSSLPENYTKGESYVERNKVYEYNVAGIGNFTGTFTMKLAVVWDKNLNLGNAAVTLDRTQYEYRGEKLTKADVKISAVKFGKVVLEEKYYEYEVYAASVGTGYIEVYPSEEGRNNGYRGMKKVNIKVVGDRQIKDAVKGDGWLETIVFSQKRVNDDGGIIQAKEGILVYVENIDAGESLEGGSDKKKTVLLEDKDYTVKYSNHKKAGTATATFTGKGRYKGTLKLKYQIMPNVKAENFTIIWKNVTRTVTDGEEAFKIAYQKGGAIPEFVLMDQDKNILKNKTDYTVKLIDNKSAGSTMTCNITGKGNYKGYSASKQIEVTPADIGKGTITVADKQESKKANAWQSKPTIKDVNGKTLTAGTDYDKVFMYTDKNGRNVTSPAAGDTVTITVQGINNYKGSSITGDYRIFATNISKLKITIDAQVYTGKEIILKPIKDIHVYDTSSDQKKKTNEIIEDCYKIIEHKNNIKAGTAKVTLRGIGAYGGTKTYSFKIIKKSYLINQVKGITLDKTSLALSMQGDNTEKGKFTATITAADDKIAPANPTVIWSTSNSNIAAIESDVKEPDKDGGSHEATATAHIILKKEGSVTITATTQDGGKKAKCTVTIVDVPILEKAGKIITMNVKGTHQLRFENEESWKPDLSGITWTISNSDIVSVDKETGILTANDKAGVVVLKLTKGKYIQQCYVIVEGDEEAIPGTYREFKRWSDSGDDTASIRQAIINAYNDKTCNGIYIPAGVYWIDATADYNNGIFLDGREGTWNGLIARDTMFEIRMSPGTLFMTIGNSVTNYYVISMAACNNITISGGTIIGERNEHTGKGGEAGHGIGILDCTDIQIENMDISQCWGDGIYLGRLKDKSSVDNERITIKDCNVHDNRRNNLSITSADGVTISGGSYNNAKGTDPQYGIDIETNTSRACKNIKISNVTIKGNAKGSVGIMAKAENVTLEGCHLYGNFYNWGGTNVVLRRVTFHSGGVNNKPGLSTKIE